MASVKVFWVAVFCLAVGVGGTAGAQGTGSPLGSLAESPPLQPSIFFVGKTTTNDFSGPGMGEHLQYFPAFNLSEEATNLRTDCGFDAELTPGEGVGGCLESTPDFENFRHHTPGDPTRRTFSLDSMGTGVEGDPDYIPEGVKTAGGNSSWEEFTLPDGTVGLSGTTFDLHSCENQNNFVNQIRINTATLSDFCLNVITDNTAGMHNPTSRLEARTDNSDLDVNIGLDSEGNALADENGDPVLSFDGQTDMYTFRYMGMKEGDRVKIRIGEDSGGICGGPGVGGIMVSHISTCTPEPGTCTPVCEVGYCGDDGCGNSCGICPGSTS